MCNIQYSYSLNQQFEIHTVEVQSSLLLIMSFQYDYALFVLLGACEPLTAPDNGMIECDFGDDGFATKGDTCVFTCEDGFEGGTIRKCWPWWGRMRWIGHEAVCKEGMVKATYYFEVRISTS